MKYEEKNIGHLPPPIYTDIVTAQPQPQPNSTSTLVGVDKVISWSTHPHPKELFTSTCSISQAESNNYIYDLIITM